MSRDADLSDARNVSGALFGVSVALLVFFAAVLVFFISQSCDRTISNSLG